MKLRLEAAFTEADIQKEIETFMERVFKVTRNEMMQIGLEFVSEARSKVPDVDYSRDAKDIVAATKLAGGSINLAGAGGFNDQTGNLRSSIGFILLYDGEIVHEDFELSPRGTEKAEGLRVGREKAMEIAKENPEGWAIITVAGMEYASWVEAKGYDVITGSTLGAQAKLEKAAQNVLKAFK